MPDAILKLLIDNRHRVVSIEEILGVLGPGPGNPRDRVFHQIWRLRRSLGEGARDRVATVAGYGYQFIDDDRA